MTRPLVIIHGWSDQSTSFKNLAKQLARALNCEPQFINIADYISMDDDVTYADIVTAMSRAWRSAKLPETPRSVDVIVHSTGGLIIRDWLVRHYKPTTAPIKHLVMLAPANFGSHLAHKGRAFYGRVLKGFKGRKMFHVGTQLLKGLELASPYSWQLAQLDRFGDDEFYGSGKILCTVLVGNTGYSGISSAANRNGSDGTVPISCANLNCNFLDVDFSQDPLSPTTVFKKSNGITAFGVVDDKNHTTITTKGKSTGNSDVFAMIVDALQVTDDKFQPWSEHLSSVNTHLLEKYQNKPEKHGFQNMVVFVHNQFNQPVKDYFLEFYGAQGTNHSSIEDIFYSKIIHSVHVNHENSSYRSFYLNCTRLYQELNHSSHELKMSVTATPNFQPPRNIVGYQTYDKNVMGAIQIQRSKLYALFSVNQTLLMRIKLRREQAGEVFEIKGLTPLD